MCHFNTNKSIYKTETDSQRYKKIVTRGGRGGGIKLECGINKLLNIQ